jgi:hypothetical protein
MQRAMHITAEYTLLDDGSVRVVNGGFRGGFDGDASRNDGKPGITVFVKLFGLIKGEIYLARREIFQNDMTLYSDGTLRRSVIDDSEQLVVGASLGILNTPNTQTSCKIRV